MHEVRRITHLSEEQLDIALESCAKAFLGDKGPFGRAAIGGDPLENWELWREFNGCSIRAALRDGELYAVGDDFSGVACWFGPGQAYIANQEQIEACGFDKFFESLSENAKDWWKTEFLPKFAAMAEPIGPARKLAGYHLHLIWTRPDMQRKGIARALVEHMLEKVDKEGAFSTVETTNEPNVEMYKSFGYVPRSVVRAESAFGDYDMTMLTREPKAMS